MEALLPSSGSGISPKISRILQSHVYPRFGRVLRALARVKSALLDAIANTKWPGARRQRRRRRRKQQQQRAAIGCGGGRSSKKKKKNWSTTNTNNSGGGLSAHLTYRCSGAGALSSSPARSAAAEALDVDYHVYPSCDSVWNAVVVPAAAAGGGEYCGYLRWLEEEMPAADDVVVVMEEEEDDDDDEAAGEEDADADGGNEIDRLAEQFIARCRAKFLLEKQESYDRCQEMIARSL